MSTTIDANAPTLVVDLDGTLTPSDTLVESVMKIIRQKPGALFSLGLALFAGRAAFKQRVAELVVLSPEHLPWRRDVLDYLAAARASGRRIVLATAAHHTIAEAVARHLSLFDEVLCTRGTLNLKGEAKLAAIRARIGPNFVYAGDSRSDIPIWNSARGALLAGRASRKPPAISVSVHQVFTDDGHLPAEWLRALRPHQWVKNLLVFVPLLTSFQIHDTARLGAALLGLTAFCLAASATYIVNDIWDVERDRQHPRKRLRPFASGVLKLHHGLAVAIGLLTASIVVSLAISPAFLVFLCGYASLTSAYSWFIKTYILLDVLTLAVLYTWRVLAGSVAVSVPISTWLLAFSVFLFFSLALVKRCAELLTMQSAGRSVAVGRDYSVRDLVVLWPLGVGASLSAVVVLGLYIGSPEAASRYESPELLWLVGLTLLYWVARLWIKVARGEMHDDPIVFALKDSGSRKIVALLLVLAVAAHFVRIA